VIVADALAGGVTVAGLTVQTGGSTGDCVDEVTWQAKSTVPVNPGSVVTEIVVDEVPPGATASGESGEASRLKFCAEAADDSITQTATRHSVARLARRARKNCCTAKNWMKLSFDNPDCDDSDFHMSRFWFK